MFFSHLYDDKDGRFQNIGIPQNHPFLIGFSIKKPSILGGFPLIFGNTQDVVLVERHEDVGVFSSVLLKQFGHLKGGNATAVKDLAGAAVVMSLNE